MLPGWTGSFVIWVYAGDENGQASEALANNGPANDAEARFHDALYGAGGRFGQVRSFWSDMGHPSDAAVDTASSG
jgi:hypothetical protein